MNDQRDDHSAGVTPAADGTSFGPAASLPMLQARAALLAETRRCFDEHGYWEVETPILSHDIVVDAWLEPFVVVEPASTPRTSGPEISVGRAASGIT